MTSWIIIIGGLILIMLLIINDQLSDMLNLMVNGYIHYHT